MCRLRRDGCTVSDNIHFFSDEIDIELIRDADLRRSISFQSAWKEMDFVCHLERDGYVTSNKVDIVSNDIHIF